MAFPVSAEYALQLADNALVLGHRNSEWTGHGPILEQDIALSNIALDLIGQARYLYQHAARLMGGEVTEDVLAYGRDGWDFRNCLLVEQETGVGGKRSCVSSSSVPGNIISTSGCTAAGIGSWRPLPRNPSKRSRIIFAGAASG